MNSLEVAGNNFTILVLSICILTLIVVGINWIMNRGR